MSTHVGLTHQRVSEIGARVAALIDPTTLLVALRESIRPHTAEVRGDPVADSDLKRDISEEQAEITLLCTIVPLHQ